MRQLLLSILFLACACSASPPAMAAADRTVWVDSRFTQEQRKAIVEALARWHTAVGLDAGRVRLCNHDQCVKGAADDEFSFVYARNSDPGMADAPANLLAYVDDLYSPRVTVFAEHADGLELADILTHEVGHSLGLPHIPVKSAVMYPYYHPMGCIDFSTVLEYAVINPVHGELQETCEAGPHIGPVSDLLY